MTHSIDNIYPYRHLPCHKCVTKSC